ncbi:MAG: hypothetical protein LBM08_15640 [Dysgonamonadaceae bacterium]|jgi:hypothetical protein|nr:hypothetical protein [Dysgonamonadaceae bacterium]
MKIFLPAFCISLLFISCTNTNRVNSYLIDVEKWLGKTIIIPDSLSVYHEDDFFCYSNNYIDTTKYHIISSIDGTCHQCMEAFELWQDIINEFSNDVQFIFIVKTHAPKQLLFIMERLHFHYPVIIDQKGAFEYLNQIDEISNTVLTDSNLNIVLVGNPIFNKKIKDLYLKLIVDAQVVSK